MSISQNADSRTFSFAEFEAMKARAILAEQQLKELEDNFDEKWSKLEDSFKNQIGQIVEETKKRTEGEFADEIVVRDDAYSDLKSDFDDVQFDLDEVRAERDHLQAELISLERDYQAAIQTQTQFLQWMTNIQNQITQGRSTKSESNKPRILLGKK